MRNHTSTALILQTNPGQIWNLASLALFCALFATACAIENPRSNQARALGEVAVASDLPELNVCIVPDPRVPSYAFEIFKSETMGRSGYWVRYRCKQDCDDWRQRLVPACTDDNGTLISDGPRPDLPKRALAYVVDGMGRHLALSSDGEKTVLIHTGAGGTRYYDDPADTLEKHSNAHTVMVCWEKGYTSSFSMPPFPAPVAWGWYSRTSENATNKQWRACPGSHHCSAIDDEALVLVKERMGL